MPRAERMPRTRALRTARTVTGVLGAVLLVAGGAVVRSLDGSDRWVGLGVLVVVVAGFGAISARVLRWLSSRASAALANDLTGLTPSERSLPFGAVPGPGGSVGLPTKRGVVVIAGIVLALVLLAALGAALDDDADAQVARWVLLGAAALVAVAIGMIVGTRVRLAEDGIVSTMGLPRRHRWLDVPDLEIDGQNVVLKAAGARRPRVRIRVGLLEVSVSDCVALIRRMRGW